MPELETAWASFYEILDEIRRGDAHQLGRIEAEVEALAQAGPEQRHRIPPPPRLMAERLGDDVRDAWARLYARDLIGVLRTTGESLRSISEEVHVSTPYLSQLANGTGPVPSEKIIARLRGGVRDMNLKPVERGDGPEVVLEPLTDRIRQLRQELRKLALTRPQPHVRIEGLGPKDERRIAPLLDEVLQRCVDDGEGQAMWGLLEDLASADAERREALTLVANSEDVAAIVAILGSLDEKARKGLLSLLQAVEPVTDSALVAEPKMEKTPLPGGRFGTR